MTEASPRPRVLVTRPSADAIPLAGEMQRRGFDVLLQPLLRIETPEGPPPDLAGVQALLFTSANGVRAFARRSDARTLAVYAVGDATAAAAQAEGFLSVASAGGDVHDLAALVRERVDPAAGKLLHASGSDVAGDLAGTLRAAGFAVERVKLYTAHQTERFDPAVRAAVSEGAVDAVLFFSPRSAAGFVTLVRAEGLAEACRSVAAFCLSDAVAEAASPIPWRSVAVAPEPTQQSLLATLERELIETSQPEARTDSPAGGDILETGDATAVVERFGGIRPMATKLGVPVTTVQGWKARGHIPENRFDTVRAAASAHGVDLSVADEASTPGGIAADQPAPEPDDSPPSAAEAVAAAAAPAPSPIIGSGVAWAALVLAVAALAAVASYRYWGPFVGGPPETVTGLADRVERLETAGAPDEGLRQRLQRAEQRIDTATRDVARLRDAAKEPEAVAADIGTLRASVDALSQRMAQAEQRAGVSAGAVTESLAALRDLREEAAALRRAVAAVDERVKALETRRPATGERIAALAVAAGQIETALDAGRPYGGQLERLKALAGDETAIAASADALDPWAKSGVPTVADLSRRFEGIAPKLRVPAAEASDGGWLDALRVRAMALVNMRPLGAAGETSPVTRAERALARSDLSAAVSALDGVSGPVDGWRGEARSRIAADAAVATLRARIVDRLAVESQRSADGGPAAGASGGTRTP
jgi:uroporphyrinogen-III synthase